MRRNVEAALRIREKLSQAATHGWRSYRGRCFGIEKHQLQLHPPLSKQERLSLERELGVSLPGGFVVFLEQVGRAGAGPFYGLLPHEAWHDAFHIESYADISLRPAQPCALRPNLPPKKPDWLVAAGGPEWEHRMLIGDWDPYQGAIAISHQGCANYSLLLLTGPYRGCICNVDLDLQPPIFAPYADYLAWYEGWLDSLLTGNKIGWYGYPEE